MAPLLLLVLGLWLGLALAGAVIAATSGRSAVAGAALGVVLGVPAILFGAIGIVIAIGGLTVFALSPANRATR